MTYFAAYSFLLFLSIRFLHVKSGNVKFLNSVIFSFLVFVLIAGLRYEIGVDYFSYVRAFEDSLSISDFFVNPKTSFAIFQNNSWEPLSKLFFIILRSVTNDPQIVFFIASIICSVFLFKSLRYFSTDNHFFLSLLIYFTFVYMFQEMHALRQSLAASFLYMGLYQLALQKNNKALLYCLLAVGFHYSLVLFIPLLFLLKRKISVKIQLILLCISLIIFLLGIPWLTGILEVFAGVFDGLNLALKIVHYLDADSFQRPFFITYILYLLPYLFLLYQDRKKKIFDSPAAIIAQNMYLLYLLFTMLFWEYAYFSVRYGWICLWGMAICLPKTLDYFKRTSRFVPLLYIYFFSYIIINTFLFPNSTTMQFTPYESYIECKWFGVKGTGRERAETYLAGVGLVLRD